MSLLKILKSRKTFIHRAWRTQEKLTHGVVNPKAASVYFLSAFSLSSSSSSFCCRAFVDAFESTPIQLSAFEDDCVAKTALSSRQCNHKMLQESAVTFIINTLPCWKPIFPCFHSSNLGQPARSSMTAAKQKAFNCTNQAGVWRSDSTTQSGDY